MHFNWEETNLRASGSFAKIPYRLPHPFVCFFACALCLLTPGCAVSHFAANHLVAAPNLHDRMPARRWAHVWTNVLANLTTNELRSTIVPVGPPAATLAVLEVPPRDYRCKFVSRIEEHTNGTKRFSVVLQPATNAVFQPLPQPATIILLHGYGMMKESMAPWAFTLAQSGYRVLLLDLRGHGDSTGDTISFGKIESRDLRQALDDLIARGFCDERVGVLGVSYGASLALHWAASDARVRAVVAIAPYDQPDEAISRFITMQKVRVPGRVVRHATAAAAKKLELEWEDWSASTSMRGISQPVLLVGAGNDPVSRPSDIELLERTTAGEVQSIIVPDANHYILGFLFEQIEQPIKNWFRQHLVAAGDS